MTTTARDPARPRPVAHELAVPRQAAGERLDRFLAARIESLSRSRLKALIQAGAVAVDGAPEIDPARKLRPGQAVRVAVPAPADAAPRAQAIALDVVHEDAHLIVIDKPAGLVVHPAPGNPDRTLVNALLAHCGASLAGVGGVRRPGIVHRLDKGTSGLMVVAKSDAALAGLADQFARRTILRAYRAVVWGVPAPAAGVIEGAIGRNPRNRKKMAVVERGGKPARTRYRVERALGEALASVVVCRLETGRTHQIRVHLAHLGHGVVGDPVYGSGPARLKRAAPAAARSFPHQALHAFLLGFVHPLTRQQLRFEVGLPEDIEKLIDAFGKTGQTP